MAKKHFSEADIKKIASKYIHSVRREASGVPNLQKIITESLTTAAPHRRVEPQDVQNVLSHLQSRNTFSNKHINEAAKKVVDQGATDDLKYMINRHIQAMGRKSNIKDVEAIIKKGKLDPHGSSLTQIKQAVRDFYSENQRAVENMSAVEIRDIVRKEVEKMVPGVPTEATVKAVADKYLDRADMEKPIDYEEVKALIKAQVSGAPQPTQPSSVKQGGKVIVPKNKINPGNWVPPKNPKKMTFFEKIRYKMRRYGLKSLSRGARNWLSDTVNKTRRSPDRKMLLAENESVAEAFIGKMFMYFYDAKTKDDLPYWDKFPLIFVIEMYKDGWLGLNLHYLPLTIRVRLFDKLLEFADDKSLDKVQKLQLSYALLKSVSQYPEVRPTIKRYLAQYVKSDLVKVEPIDWEIATFLPVEQFQKEKKERVWADSKKKIQNLRKSTSTSTRKK